MMIRETTPFQYASKHQIWDSYLKYYMSYAGHGYARSEVRVKVTVTQYGMQHTAIPGCIHTPNLGFLPDRI